MLFEQRHYLLVEVPVGVPKWLIAPAAAVQATWDSFVVPVDMEGDVSLSDECRERRRRAVTLHQHSCGLGVQWSMK